MKKEDLEFINSSAKIKNRVASKSYYFNELPKALRERAFTVANVETLNQIKIIQQSLANAQKEGLSFREWKSNLDQDAVRNLTQARLETVYRTNLSSSYMQSTRYNAVTSGVMPYMMFSAVGDSRTRPEHEKLDGKVVKADSTFWDKYSPPLSYNCRCTLIPLTKEDAKKYGISKIDESKLPEPQFGDSKLGDVKSSTYKSANQAINDLPINSPYRAKFQQAQDNIKNLIDPWWDSVQNDFKD